MRLSAGLSRLSVSITSGGAVATAVAASSAVDALSTAAIGVVGAGCIAHCCGSCQPECDQIFHMAPLRIISWVLAASESINKVFITDFYRVSIRFPQRSIYHQGISSSILSFLSEGANALPLSIEWPVGCAGTILPNRTE